MASAGHDDALQRRVLVSTDDSELGELARRWAARCARELGVALVTLQGGAAPAAETLAAATPAELLVLGLAGRQGRVPDAAVDLAAVCHAEVRLLHTRPLPLRRSSRPGPGLVTRTALYHARSPVAIVHATHPVLERKRTQKRSTPLTTPGAMMR